MSARLSALLVIGGLPLLPMTGDLANVNSPVANLKTSEKSLQNIEIKTDGDNSVALGLTIPGFTGKPRLTVIERPYRIVLDLEGVLRGNESLNNSITTLKHPLIIKKRIAQFALNPNPITRIVLEVPEGTKAQTYVDGERVSLVVGARIDAGRIGIKTETNMIAKANGGSSAAKHAIIDAEKGLSPKLIGDNSDKYHGQRMTLDLKSDFGLFLKAIADFTGMNLIADEEVKNLQISVFFKDAPWDQILDHVCKQKGLGKAIENGVIRVAKMETLKKEEEQLRQLEGTKSLTGELPRQARSLLNSKVANIDAGGNGIKHEAPALANVSIEDITTKSAMVGAVKEAVPKLPDFSINYKMLPVITTNVGNAKLESKNLNQASAPALENKKSRLIGTNSGKYYGQPMTLDLKSDFGLFLRAIVDFTGMNMIADDDVENLQINILFKDTPWDQILDYVCKQKGLGKVIENGVIRVAKMETLKKEEDQLRQLEEAKSLSGDLQTQTRPLSFAKAEEVKTLVEKVKSPRGSIIFDTRTNTLFITDLPKQMPLIMDFINTLDVAIQQVTIEAKIVEANIGWEKAFGVKWPTSNGGEANLMVGNKAAMWAGTDQVTWNSVNGRGNNYPTGWLAYSGGKDQVTSLSSAAGEAWVSFLSPRMNVNFILQAIQTEGNARIVASPKLITQNNAKGNIISGEKIPYPMMQAGNNAGAITVTYATADLKLEVTPQITNDGTIIMDLVIEKSEADFSRTVAGQPTILRRELTTRVLVKDGGTAVLGGVYIKKNQYDSAGVPFFSKLPFLGGLFRNKKNQENSKELLIFITPRIYKE